MHRLKDLPVVDPKPDGAVIPITVAVTPMAIVVMGALAVMTVVFVMVVAVSVATMMALALVAVAGSTVSATVIVMPAAHLDHPGGGIGPLMGLDGVAQGQRRGGKRRQGEAGDQVLATHIAPPKGRGLRITRPHPRLVRLNRS